LFADPEFDGEPALLTEEEINSEGESIEDAYEVISEELEPSTVEDEGEAYVIDSTPELPDDSEGEVKKYYVDGENVEIVADVVYELDSNGDRLQVIKYTDYTKKKIRSMYTSTAELKSKWSDAEQRKIIIEKLEDKGISFEHLADVTKQYDGDPFDLICHVAFNAPLRSRRERAENVRKNQSEFFTQYGEVANDILNEILDKYIEYGYAQLNDMNILKVPPISNHGNVIEIAENFGGVGELRDALSNLQNMIYA
jgi:Type I site-specific restriction-modification system, R (restriction) subunit and related helicases